MQKLRGLSLLTLLFGVVAASHHPNYEGPSYESYKGFRPESIKAVPYGPAFKPGPYGPAFKPVPYGPAYKPGPYGPAFKPGPYGPVFKPGPILPSKGPFIPEPCYKPGPFIPSWKPAYGPFGPAFKPGPGPCAPVFKPSPCVPPFKPSPCAPLFKPGPGPFGPHFKAGPVPFGPHFKAGPGPFPHPGKYFNGPFGPSFKYGPNYKNVGSPLIPFKPVPAGPYDVYYKADSKDSPQGKPQPIKNQNNGAPASSPSERFGEADFSDGPRSYGTPRNYRTVPVGPEPPYGFNSDDQSESGNDYPYPAGPLSPPGYPGKPDVPFKPRKCYNLIYKPQPQKQMNECITRPVCYCRCCDTTECHALPERNDARIASSDSQVAQVSTAENKGSNKPSTILPLPSFKNKENQQRN